MTTTLTVTTSGVPVVTSDVVLRVPAEWPEIAELHRRSKDSQQDAYRSLLLQLLKRVAPFERSEEIVSPELALPDPPQIHAGIAEIAFRTRQPLAYYDSVTAPWLVKPHGGVFAFRIVPVTPRIAVLWHVNVTTDGGMKIEGSDPLPATAEPGLRQWQFKKGALVEPVQVEARPTQRVREKLPSGGWRSYLRGASGWLRLMLIPALLVLLGRRGILGDTRSARYATSTNWVRRIAAATLFVVTAELALFTVAGWVGSWVEQRASKTHWYYGFTLFALSEIVAATLAIAFVLPRLVGAPTMLAHLRSAAIALVVLVASLPLVLVYWPPEEAPAVLPRSSIQLNALAIVLVLALGTYIVQLAFRATARLVGEIGIKAIVLELVGRRLRAQLPRLSLPAAWSRPRLRTSTAIVGAFAVSAYWLLDRYVEFKAVADRVDGLRFSDWLRFFPVELLYALDRLLWLLLLLALLGVLAAAGASAKTAILEPRRVLSLTLGLMLAGWSVGLGGSFFGFAAPFPALLTMLAVAYFTRHHLEDRREAIVKANPPDGTWKPPSFGDKAFRAEMLARARAIAAVRREKGKLYREYRERDKSENEYDTAYRKAQREENKLRRGGVAASPRKAGQGAAQARARRDRLLALPDGSPYSFALSLGPRENWWRNGALAGALAAPLAVLPLARYGYGYVWPSSGFAPLYVFASFAFELARWVVAGVVFGCCYAYLPGRVGPVKAVALLSAIGLPVALLSLIPRTETSSGLSSDLLLLGLFLVVVGIVMDWLTLRERTIDSRHLGDLYELHLVRKAAALAPIVFAILVAANKIAGGKWGDLKDLSSGIFDLIKSL